MDTEDCQRIMEIINEHILNELYDVMGGEPLYISKLMRFIREKKLKEALENGTPFEKIARRLNITKRTVYRKFTKLRKKL